MDRRKELYGRGWHLGITLPPSTCPRWYWPRQAVHSHLRGRDAGKDIRMTVCRSAPGEGGIHEEIMMKGFYGGLHAR
jgi:hypothetical protein